MDLNMEKIEQKATSDLIYYSGYWDNKKKPVNIFEFKPWEEHYTVPLNLSKKPRINLKSARSRPSKLQNDHLTKTINISHKVFNDKKPLSPSIITFRLPTYQDSRKILRNNMNFNNNMICMHDKMLSPIKFFKKLIRKGHSFRGKENMLTG